MEPTKVLLLVVLVLLLLSIFVAIGIDAGLERRRRSEIADGVRARGKVRVAEEPIITFAYEPKDDITAFELSTILVCFAYDNLGQRVGMMGGPFRCYACDEPHLPNMLGTAMRHLRRTDPPHQEEQDHA